MCIILLLCLLCTDNITISVACVMNMIHSWIHVNHYLQGTEQAKTGRTALCGSVSAVDHVYGGNGARNTVIRCRKVL